VAYRIDAWNMGSTTPMPMYGWRNPHIQMHALGEAPILQLGELELEADGDGWGYNAGLLWKPSERLSVGISYRSEIELDFDGDRLSDNRYRECSIYQTFKPQSLC
jgi:long-subunit fatty acid transport protein